MFGFLKHFFKLQFLLILLAIAAGIYYPQILERLKEATSKLLEGESVALHFSNSNNEEVKLFTNEQLAEYDGENGAPLYLALLGNVYDVSKGAKHYGAGCSYNFFVGRDASVSFISGEFDNFVAEQADDVVGQLKPADFLSLANWQKFYDTDYVYKGKLIGRFYDESGTPTTYYHKYVALLQQAKDAKAATEQLRAEYPDCNIEWSVEKGTRVWCTTTSGDGKARDWIGHPRKFFVVGSDAYRCACIREEDLDTTAVMIKPYENCEVLAHECYYKVD